MGMASKKNPPLKRIPDKKNPPKKNPPPAPKPTPGGGQKPNPAPKPPPTPGSVLAPTPDPRPPRPVEDPGEGNMWAWDGTSWVPESVGNEIPMDNRRPRGPINAPQPTSPPGDGMYWAPVLGPEGEIASWAATPIPGYTPPNSGPRPGYAPEEKRGAKQRLNQLLTQYGLSSLIDTVNNLVEEWGANNDTVIMSYLRESTPYKQRFRGNEDRIKNGYGALSEAEYIGVETSIRAKMRDFGLDGAFYSNEKIAGLIGGDVSADEVSDRLTRAKKIIDNADTNIKNSLVNLYGAGMGDLVGYVLDPALAQESLQRKVNAGVAYGVARSQGLELDRTLSEQIGELTYGDERTARQALGQAGDMARSVRRLTGIESDTSLTDADVVEQQFGLDAEAGTKVKKLQSRERARFGGSSGAFAGTLSSGNY